LFGRVSIPFIAGQWSLQTHFIGLSIGFWRVSIPFIAGQWSLPESNSPNTPPGGSSFNPLHCGAVVASFGLGFTLDFGLASFNPLHCGAVVASRCRRCPRRGASASFQSPSLRGSGRFSTHPRPQQRRPQCFNPLHCGAVVASYGPINIAHQRTHVSIPFIAGQWSLQL